MRISINVVGIAGPMLAYWRRKSDHDVLLVERALWMLAFAAAPRLSAQIPAYFQPLAIPPRDVGTCALLPRSDTGTKARLRSRLIMKNQYPGADREMSILRGKTGTPVTYTELSGISTGTLASTMNNIIAVIHPDGRISGWWAHNSLQMSPNDLANLDNSSRRRAVIDSVRTHLHPDSLDATAQRKVRELAHWLDTRCPT